MKKRVTYINIEGVDYPMVASFNAFRQLSTCHSFNTLFSKKNIGESAEGEENLMEQMEGLGAILDMLSMLIQAGTNYINSIRAYRRDLHLNFNEDNTEIEAPTAEELGDMLIVDKNTVEYIGKKIRECLSASQSSDIQAVADPKKNDAIKRRPYDLPHHTGAGDGTSAGICLQLPDRRTQGDCRLQCNSEWKCRRND